MSPNIYLPRGRYIDTTPRESIIETGPNAEFQKYFIDPFRSWSPLVFHCLHDMPATRLERRVTWEAGWLLEQSWVDWLGKGCTKHATNKQKSFMFEADLMLYWLSTLEAWNSFSLPSNKSVAIHPVSILEDLGDGVSTHLLDADGQLRTWATWREIADCAYPVGQTWNYDEICMDVSKNRGTPKSSTLIGFSIINHPFWVPLFLETPIFEYWIFES